VGGVPQYFELFDSGMSAEDNLRGLLSSSMILDDAGTLLRDQLSEPRNYVGIVEAIAAGFTRVTEIAQMSGLATTNVSKYLSVLQHLGIVERQVPATESRPEQSKQGRYRVADSYLRYFYRFLAPSRTLLERGYRTQVWDNIRQHLNEFVGSHVFEELSQEWVLRQGDAGRLPFIPRRVGAYWGRRGPQIDVVAVNEDARAVLIGECTWTGEPVGRSVVADLIAKTPDVLEVGLRGDAESWRVSYAFFSRSGFTAEARKAAGSADCLWVDLDQLDRELRE
jgi:AAA+ ATPase superfamily predicted ATPase